MEIITTRFTIDRAFAVSCLWTLFIVAVIWLGWAITGTLLKGVFVAVMAAANALVLGLVIRRSAWHLNRADEEKNRVEEKLQRALENVEAASKAKSDLLANMSHEFRTPLNAVVGFSEILADETFGELNARQQKYVDNVLSSGRHLLKLVNDVLDISSIEAGGARLERVDMDVEAMLGGVETVLGVLAAEKQIAFSTTVAPSMPPLFADPARFKQIMLNLLGNAIKFTPEGGAVAVQAIVWESSMGENGDSARVPAWVASRLRPGGYLLVSVVDSGIGILPRDQSRLFKAFEQIDSAYARQQEGTGLGLALTRRLVEVHGGAIWIESDGIEGKGSAFRFVLPFQEEQVSDGLLPNRPDRRSRRRAVSPLPLPENERLTNSPGRTSPT